METSLAKTFDFQFVSNFNHPLIKDKQKIITTGFKNMVLEKSMIMLDKDVAKLDGKVDQDSAWKTSLGPATCDIAEASVPDNSVLLVVCLDNVEWMC
jgi:hypothetical protein